MSFANPNIHPGIHRSRGVACALGFAALTPTYVLAHLQAVDFKTLVPGHGTPMNRAQFATWRVAYGNLLACADGTSTTEASVDGWLSDAKTLVPAQDRPLARNLLGYYLDNVLRDASKVKTFCAG